MSEKKPDSIEVTLDRIWHEIYGTNGRGILKKQNELEDYMKMIENMIDKYVSIEKDFKIEFLEERAKQKKETFWKGIGLFTSLSGWAAFVISIILIFAK